MNFDDIEFAKWFLEYDTKRTADKLDKLDNEIKKFFF